MTENPCVGGSIPARLTNFILLLAFNKAALTRLLYRLKTALDINDTLLAKPKAVAASQRTSLTRFIEEELQLRQWSHCPKYAHGV